jgi:hypothetical protein
MTIQSWSQSYFTTGSLPPVSSLWRKAPWDSRHSNFIFQLNTCSYITSSLTRGWVCHLQLLPAQSFSGLIPMGLMTTFYCLRFETPLTWWSRSLYLYPPETGWPSYNPKHWVPFSLPPTTHRATVEVFNPSSTRVEWQINYISLPPYNFGANQIQVTTSNSSCVILCLSIALEMCVNFVPTLWFLQTYPLLRKHA